LIGIRIQGVKDSRGQWSEERRMLKFIDWRIMGEFQEYGERRERKG